MRPDVFSWPRQIGDVRPTNRADSGHSISLAGEQECFGGQSEGTTTRDQFFDDLSAMLQLLSQLGIPDILEAETAARIARMRAGGPGITPEQLRQYADAMDDAGEENAKVLRDLVKVLLRIVAGLGAELENFRNARG